MTDDFIRDDTDLGLLERTNFQTIDSVDYRQVDAFVDEVDRLAEDHVHPARSPYVRILIGAVMATFVLGVGFIMSSSEPKVSVAENTSGSGESELTLGLSEREASTTVARDREVEDLRSELALLEQQVELASVDRHHSAPPARSVNSPDTQPNANGSQESSAAAIRAVPAPPRPAPVSQPVSAVSTQPRPFVPRPVSPARPTPAARPVVPASRPEASPSLASPSPEPVDPLDAWYAASHAGMYGQMTEIDVRPQLSVAVPESAPQPLYSLRNTALVDYREPVEPVQSPADEFSQRIPGLISSESHTIPIGRAVSAQVVTPIVWLNANDQFLIQLEADLLDTRGRAAIPANAYVIVQPVEVDESSGFAQLAVVGISIDDQITPIDYQSVAIRGEGGNPLIASRYGDIGGDIAANDVEMFAVGALNGIGRVLTRPNSQVITNSTFGATSNTDFGERNILGAILAGGTEQLTERMAARNDERLNDIRSRKEIFYLPEGTSVQLYVNSSFLL